MNINDIAPPSGDSFKFETVGDTVKGVITFVPSRPEPRINKFNGREEEVVKVILDTADGDKAIYPVVGSVMARAIGDAVRGAGATTLEVGGTLAVQFSGERDTGKPMPMKEFKAKYEAPVQAAALATSDLF